MGIKSKLLINYLLLIVISVSVLSFFISNKSQEIVFKEVTEKSESITELITMYLLYEIKTFQRKLKLIYIFQKGY